MAVVENNLNIINQTVKELFETASLIKFSYSGIFTLEFEMTKSYIGFNSFCLDFGTKASIYKIRDEKPFEKAFSLEDLFHIWPEKITEANVGKDLSLNIYFKNSYCLRVVAEMFDPEKIFDMRWELYQRLDSESLRILVSDENTISMQKP